MNKFIDKNKEPRETYFDESYENYIVEFIGDIETRIKAIEYAELLSKKNIFATISVKKGMVPNLLNEVPEIINTQRSYPFNLSQLELINTPYYSQAFNKNGILYEGEGVIVGIIGTGIDYTNERFYTRDRRPRVIAIWDQTLEKNLSNTSILYGREFIKVEIEEAVKEKLLGRDPFVIVNHKDENGHGTAIAGIIGGRQLGVNDEFESAAPKCEFAIVKLKEAKKSTLEMYGIEPTTKEVYESADIIEAINYLADLQVKLDKPMIIYLPLGTNCGGHDGGSITERYIETFALRKGVAIICNTGNQGDTETHVTGDILKSGDSKSIFLKVDNEQKNLFFSLWARKPDIVSIGVVSPSGASIEKIDIPQVNGTELSIPIGESTINIQYLVEQQGNGDQRINILINNITGGVWEFKITGEYIINGSSNAWLLQRELIKKETKFLNSDPNTTLMTPSTSLNIITTGSFNQNNNVILLQSGRGFTRDGRVKPSVATSAVEILTVGLNNSLTITTGPAMAGAILAGACVLLFEWGLVLKNDINMYAPKLNTYIIRGTVKIPGIVYPNREWGFGALSYQQVFNNLVRSSSGEGVAKESQNYVVIKNKLFFRIPYEVYSSSKD